MRRQLREFPTDLPHARLYLDDIETITQEITATILQHLQADAAEVNTIYEIGNDQMDAISDLSAQGGSTKQLVINITGPGYLGAYLDIDGSASPTLRLYGFRDEEQWAVYGKIRELFERRRSTLKNIVAAIPMPVVWVALGLLVTAQLADDVLKETHQSAVVRNTIEICYLVLLFWVFLGIGIHLNLSNRVYLVRYHERSRASTEVRRKYMERAITFILGAVGAEVLHHFIARLLK
jgi:hypothetical protein